LDIVRWTRILRSVAAVVLPPFVGSLFVSDPETPLGIVCQGRPRLEPGRTGNHLDRAYFLVNNDDLHVVIAILVNVVSHGYFPVRAGRQGGVPLVFSRTLHCDRPSGPPSSFLALGNENLSPPGVAPGLVCQPHMPRLIRTHYWTEVRTGVRGQAMFLP